jgi:hypothetical protein
MADLPDPLEEQMTLQERCIGRIHKRKGRSIEELTAPLALQCLLDLFEQGWNECGSPVVSFFAVSIGMSGCDIGKDWSMFDPSPIDSPGNRVFGMESRQVHLVEKLIDGVRLEKRSPIIDKQYWHLVVGRDNPKPVWPTLGINMIEREVNALFAEHDCDTLNPWARFETD